VKKLLIVLIILAGAGVAEFWYLQKSAHVSKDPDSLQPTGQISMDHKNIAYEVGGVSIKLVNGYAEVVDAPGSASKITTRYFGNEARGDLDGDGAEDIAFLLTQDGGGSGTFYYVVVALKKGDTYQGTNAVLVGDRIAPQTMEIKNSVLIANYVDRKPDEPMSAKPSLGKSKYLVVDAGKLVETPIYVASVQKGATVSSPLVVNGVAKGLWFFEASFPLKLEDDAGHVIAQSHAMALGEWMTTDYVGFSGTITFTKPIGVRYGYLVVEKDNPSGLPEHDDSRRIPVIFE